MRFSFSRTCARSSWTLSRRRATILFGMTLAMAASLSMGGPCYAQFRTSRLPVGYELSGNVEVKDVPNQAARLLYKIQDLLADEKWDEAVETLRRVAEEYSDHLITFFDAASENLLTADAKTAIN